MQLPDILATGGQSLVELAFTAGVVYTTLKKTVNGMKEDVSEIKSEQKELRGEVAEVREDVACLRGKLSQ